jgi:uncharacterized Zn finger protein (UPF0148 family)
MTAKVCPRCGTQYENLKSTTCPQCFAILVTVDEATAEELSAARAEVERSPEFQQAKAADDERFREQSFGACLGVAALTLLTIVIAVMLLISGARHRSHRFATPQPTVSVPAPLVPEPLTTLPVAAATLNEVLPLSFGPFQRQSSDAATVLTGTLTPLFHAVYHSHGQSSVDVFALPAGRPTDEQNEFQLGVSLASQLSRTSRPTLFFATEYWHFAVLAAPGEPNTPAQFRDALAAQFRK